MQPQVPRRNRVKTQPGAAACCVLSSTFGNWFERPWRVHTTRSFRKSMLLHDSTPTKTISALSTSLLPSPAFSRKVSRALKDIRYEYLSSASERNQKTCERLVIEAFSRVQSLARPRPGTSPCPPCTGCGLSFEKMGLGSKHLTPKALPQMLGRYHQNLPVLEGPVTLQIIGISRQLFAFLRSVP
jgi:hypothetical protein